MISVDQVWLGIVPETIAQEDWIQSGLFSVIFSKITESAKLWHKDSLSIAQHLAMLRCFEIFQGSCLVDMVLYHIPAICARLLSLLHFLAEEILCQ